MIILYRPSTNKVIWYKQFPWELQHDVDILDDSRISIFNNNRLRNKFDKNKKFNDLIVYDFETNKINYILKKQFNDFEIQTIGEGLAEIYNDNSVFKKETKCKTLIIYPNNLILIAMNLILIAKLGLC